MVDQIALSSAWEAYKAQDVRGIAAHVEDLVVRIRMKFPSDADPEYQEKMRQIEQTDEVRELMQFLVDEAPDNIRRDICPASGPATAMDAVLWANRLSGIMVRRRLRPAV